MSNYTKEQLAELLAKKTLQYSTGSFTNISTHQKQIQDGQIVVGRNPDQPIVIYKSDLQAHIEDYVNLVVSASWVPPEAGESDNFENVLTNINDNAAYSQFMDWFLDLPENVSQFMNFEETGSYIDPNLAVDILDHEIDELLPNVTTRQERIDQFFTEFGSLVDSAPSFEMQENQLTMSSGYEDINNNPDDPGASIIRLTVDENEEQASSNQSIESLRDRLNDYLRDVDYIQDALPVEGRPEYEEVNEGYLKFRSLNHALIIKHEEGKQISFSETNDQGVPKYLTDGFTITMWVRFLNKVSEGTLFNFGNPTRDINPHGFKLETFLLKDGDMDSQPANLFQRDEVERYLRLVVRDQNDVIRTSQFGTSFTDRTTTLGSKDNSADIHLFNYTRVPIDLTEWYFIVASYNPIIAEDSSHSTFMDANDYAPDGSTPLSKSPEFWQNMIDPVESQIGSYTNQSNYGAKCKVEIISKSDLLRARGFKPKES